MARRSYTRDARGRFASTPGGGARKAVKLPAPARRTAGSKPQKRRGLLIQRSAAAASKRKLKGLDPADQSLSGSLKRRAQKGAATRTANRLKAAESGGRIRLAGRKAPGRIGAKAGRPAEPRGPKLLPPTKEAARPAKPKRSRAAAGDGKPAKKKIRQSAAAEPAKPRPSNKGPKGRKRWLSNDQVIQANEARRSGVRYTAFVLRYKMPKKQRDYWGVSTVGGLIKKYAEKPLPFAQAGRIMDAIEAVTGIGRSNLTGVKKSVDGSRKTVTFEMSQIASKQADIAEKVGSRKPRRRRKPNP
jgi:hypothetical protein